MYQITKRYLIPFVFIVDCIGSVFYFWKKIASTPKQPKKVLFIRLEHIGDMVMATPVFEHWKKNHPDCEVHVLCRTLTEPIIRRNPYVDKIIMFNPSWFIRQEQTNKTEAQLIAELRQEQYDMIFEMHGDPRNIKLANSIADKTYLVGYDCRGLGFLLNRVIGYDGKTRMIHQNLKLIQPFCAQHAAQAPIHTAVCTDSAAKKKAAVMMKKHRLTNKKFIIINPKSGRPEKDLTDEEVVNFIKTNPSVKIVFTGSEKERPALEPYVRYAQKCGRHCANIAGQTDLLTLTELVKHAKKIYASDTAIIHIAHAVKTPYACVYKTTDQDIWGYET